MSKAQLSRLIDLPDDALDQVIEYARTLSKPAAVEHFSNLLGDSPAAIEFISSFNSRGSAPKAAPAPRPTPSPSQTPAPTPSSLPEPAPRHQRPKKKKAALHTPPPRQIASIAPYGAVYNKKNVEDDYMGGGGGSKRGSGANTPQPSVGTPRGASPQPPSQSHTPPPPPQQQAPPAQTQKSRAGGSLISDALAPKPKPRKTKPATVAKISITGGTAMHGAATALTDLEKAIRSLEITTNPTLKDSSERDDARRCNCVGTRHPLQTAAPNCTSCGKVICVREGLGPCTFCGTPLLSSSDIQAMISELRAERGRERMAADRAAHKKTAVTGGSTNPAGAHMVAGKAKWGGDDAGFVSLQEATRKPEDDAAAQARAHRDKLLAFQAQNAQRTTVRDEAADYDVGDAMAAETGGFARNQWATPEERAHKLRQQQKLLREMEWNARPEYEKRQQVLSIDVSGRKVFRKMAALERPPSPIEDTGDDDEDDEYGVGKNAAVLTDADGNRGKNEGTFSNNPLLGKMIKPVYDAQGRAERQRAAEREAEREKQKELEIEQRREQKRENKKNGKGKEKVLPAGPAQEDEPKVLHLRGRADVGKKRWRRVQDDVDNEAVILDGGIYGSALPATDEPACA